MIPEYLDLYMTLELDNRSMLQKYQYRYSRNSIFAVLYGYIKDIFGLNMVDGYFYITKNRTIRGTRKKESLSTKHRISKQKDIIEFLNEIDGKSFKYNDMEYIFHVDMYKDRFYIDMSVIFQGGVDEEQNNR